MNRHSLFINSDAKQTFIVGDSHWVQNVMFTFCFPTKHHIWLLPGQNMYLDTWSRLKFTFLLVKHEWLVFPDWTTTSTQLQTTPSPLTSEEARQAKASASLSPSGKQYLSSTCLSTLLPPRGLLYLSSHILQNAAFLKPYEYIHLAAKHLV